MTPAIPASAKPKVYVVQDQKDRNLAPAMDYGELRPVLDVEDEPRILNVPAITHKIKRQLQRFTQNDYLVLIGSPVAIAIAAAYVADLTGGRFKLLKWDNKDRRYYPLTVDLSVRRHDDD
jgi:hypothetical protein